MTDDEPTPSDPDRESATDSPPLPGNTEFPAATEFPAPAAFPVGPGFAPVPRPAVPDQQPAPPEPVTERPTSSQPPGGGNQPAAPANRHGTRNLRLIILAVLVLICGCCINNSTFDIKIDL
jgi:hypothetical protein